MGGFVEEMGGGGDRLEVAEATCACFTQTLLRTEVKYSHLLISGGDCGSRILHKYRNSRMLRPLYEMVYYSWPVERQRRMPGKLELGCGGGGTRRSRAHGSKNQRWNCTHNFHSDIFTVCKNESQRQAEKTKYVTEPSPFPVFFLPLALRPSLQPLRC